jgi:hypothetical protein
MKKVRLVSLLVVLVLSLSAASLAGCGGGTSEPTVAPTPVTSAGSVTLNAHPASLEGKTVVLRWNGKPNGDKLLNYLGDVLTQQVSGIKIVKMWEVDPATANSSESAETSVQFADEIAAQNPDLVIASQCD